MPQLGNPGGAYGYTNIQAKVIPQTMEFEASAAIVAGTPISISSTATVATTATDGVAVIGVSYEAASAAGKTLQVITLGPALMSAGGATTLGTPVIRSATTAGYVTSSAAPVTGTVVGFALGASSSNQSWVWVMPGTNTSS
jgi:hypothetical protein